jgi:hypothetical protein
MEWVTPPIKTCEKWIFSCFLVVIILKTHHLRILNILFVFMRFTALFLVFLVILGCPNIYDNNF